MPGRYAPLGKVVLEVLSIVLGVLLALAVSEWQEDRQKREVSELALRNVVAELRANQSILTSIHEINDTTISRAVEGDELADSESLQFIPGVQVRSTAWEALLSAGISNYIEYELVLTLANVYAMQQVYRETGLGLVDASMNMSAMATVQRTEIDQQQLQAQFMSFFQMILVMETALLEHYEQVLEELDVAPET